MSNTATAIKKSVVILFSFALFAAFLTVVNVGVNETGNTSLSTIVRAEAFDIGYDVVGTSPPAVKPSDACRSNCGPTQNTGGGGSGGGGGVGVYNPNVKSVYYACTSVSASGVCTINSIVNQDIKVYEKICNYRMSRGGAVVAYGGPAAVSYLKANLIGKIWNPWGASERMFRHLTGQDLGWFFYPIGWSQVGNMYYNGATAPQTEGELRWYCYETVRFKEQAYTYKSATCAPKADGRPFPYAVGYTVTYTNSNNGTVTANGTTYQNKRWTITGQSCVYVSAATPPPKVLERTDTCFWNLSHRGYYSQNKAAILNGGTLTTKQPVYKGAPSYQPYVSGKNSTAVLNNCTTTLSMNVSLSLSDGYAYYRLQGNANSQSFSTYVWDSSYTGGRRLVADIVAGPIGTRTLQAFGTHACTNPAYNKYGSWSAMPTLNFSYADCGRSKTWQCTIPHAPRINGVSNAVQVMRDGNYLPVQLGGVSITGSGVRDSNSKQVGTIADGNLSYMVKVEAGSSPFNGTNANGNKQYFELWKADKATKTTWNTWLSQPNANKTSYLTYYWSSDNGATWRMNYQAKINTGEFAVPFQDTTDGPTGTRWKTETNVDCNGVKVSNAATVLRSVNSEG